MRCTRFGSTGIDLPVIGLGTAEFLGGAGTIGAALDAGIRLIDTAESYGTEQQIAPAIAKRRAEAFVATKVSAANARPEDLTAAAERSLRALKTDHIDLYQLHWPSESVPLADTLGAMDELVDAGKVRFIGVCNFSLSLLQQARDLSRHGIQSNQLLHNAAQPFWETGLQDWCQAHQLSLIAYSPLAQGMETLLASPAGRALQHWADRLDKTAAQVALAWCVNRSDNPAGVIAIPKSRNRRRIAENAAAAGLQLPTKALAEINAAAGIAAHPKA
ncbi:aldo/keto reductase [Phaeobacter sp. QD34_3]|uniref:aldo/keto reductase n=1 Tax=unclassified Phaeobacter TaxID=2621772 RepID=UPI00237F5EE6|nr:MULTISPECIES: aldo/keto reductase [unclassified Phaeobacter]MDE4133252.1 aldo/keto reductase [Phaeobacter sp. QD34_3]MDE4136961.1 aldo/keto reductase [Phaeobacter sp. QD34_24]